MNIKTLPVLLAAAMIAASAAAQEIKKRTRSEIEACFNKSLNGEAANFDNNRRIKAKNIEKSAKTVWECWRNAVNAFDKEQLPVATTNGERDTLYWQMPTHPEPDARMPFHYIYKGEKPDAGYPLFLYMHGSGPKKSEWESGFRLCSMFDDAPSAYFIPQIPSERLYRWAVQPQQLAWEKLLRLAMLSGDINANRIYIFGISEGGYGSQRLASFYADYLAGAGPMAGGEPLMNAPAENLANTAFSLRTGEKDYGFGRNFMTYTAGKTLDSLQQLHPGLYKHNVELIPDKGHSIDYRPTTPWLAQFTRTPHPTYFYWEDYDMYGRHRKGFYNIRVNETSRNSDEERTCYEMNIKGNTIFLTVKNVKYRTAKTISNIPMLFEKSYKKADKGNITIFLTDKLFDFTKPITVIVNGRLAWKGKATPTLKSMVESCALFFDPERVFPAAIDIEIE